MVLIVGAMKEELKSIIEDFQLTPVADAVFSEYENLEKNLIVCVTGIGINNASSGLSYLLTKYQNQVDQVFALGTAGATSAELKQGDIVLIEKAIYAQVDVRAFNYQLGQVPKMPPHYLADEKLVKEVSTKLQTKWPVKVENTATLDQFVETKNQVENLIQPLPIPTKIAEMEIASYYQTAYLFGIPILGVKIVSDSIATTNQDSKLEFNQFLPVAAQQLSEILKIIFPNYI